MNFGMSQSKAEVRSNELKLGRWTKLHIIRFSPTHVSMTTVSEQDSIPGEAWEVSSCSRMPY